jgi:hypothetical protein
MIDAANFADEWISTLLCECTYSLGGAEVAVVSAKVHVTIVDDVIRDIDVQSCGACPDDPIASVPLALQGDGLRVGERVDAYPRIRALLGRGASIREESREK